MASLQTHGLTTEILQWKARNIASVITAQNVSVMALSECPSAALSCKTEKEERAKWATGQTFMDMVLQQLNQKSIFMGQPIQVACYRTVVNQLDPGENTDGCVVAIVGFCSALCRRPMSMVSQLMTSLQERSKPRSAIWASGTTSSGTISDFGLTKISSRALWRDAMAFRAVAPAMVVLRQVSATPVSGRLVILSVHLKAGRMKPTKQEIKQLSSHAVPHMQSLLKKHGEEKDDTIIIIGDLNLNLKDAAFSGLRDAGLRYVGESEVATNQQEWLLAEEAKASETYDSAWVWHREGVAAGRGWVWQDKDLGIALGDRDSLMTKLSAAATEEDPDALSFNGTYRPFCSELGRELLDSGGLLSAVKKAVMTHFKNKVNKDLSDHKPTIPGKFVAGSDATLRGHCSSQRRRHGCRHG